MSEPELRQIRVNGYCKRVRVKRVRLDKRHGASNQPAENAGLMSVNLPREVVVSVRADHLSSQVSISI